MSPNYAFIIELASRYLPPPGRLLDYGCGTAEAAALAIERGYDAYAVDTYLGVGDSPENLAVAILATRLCYNASYLPHWRFQKKKPGYGLELLGFKLSSRVLWPCHWLRARRGQENQLHGYQRFYQREHRTRPASQTDLGFR
jgi:SAM-dependent methyltransferase